MGKYRCIVCEKEFISYSKTAKYCSKECQGKGMTILDNKECPNCHKIFKPKSSRQVYCCRECRPQVQKNQIKCICKTCGKEFYEIPSRIKDGRGKYCSKECFASHMKIIKCDNCGKEIERPFSEIKDNNFCNRECKDEWMSYTFNGEKSSSWRGGCDGYRGDNWKSQRRKALKRDKNKCTMCGVTNEKSKLMVHHKIPFRFFKDYTIANDLSNLTTLCNSCHSKQESHLWVEVPFEYKDIVDSGNENINKRTIIKKYSEEEINFIKKNYDKMTYQELADKMGRTKNSVSDKILNMGLRKRKFKNKDNTERSQ